MEIGKKETVEPLTATQGKVSGTWFTTLGWPSIPIYYLG
jgi:hypothetical protein